MSHDLKESREKLNLTIEEVSEKLKIRKQYIIAMEEGAWDDIPGEVYKNGYMRMYCNLMEIPFSDSKNIYTEDKIDEGLPYDINPKHKLNIALGLILVLTIFVWYLIYNRLHDDDSITDHLENVDHKHYLIDPENNTNVELKQ